MQFAYSLFFPTISEETVDRQNPWKRNTTGTLRNAIKWNGTSYDSSTSSKITHHCFTQSRYVKGKGYETQGRIRGI